MSTPKEEKKAEKQSSGQKGGRGTHGSLTKAGKVRSQTIKIPKSNLSKHHGPSVKNRIRYEKYLARQQSSNTTKPDYKA